MSNDNDREYPLGFDDNAPLDDEDGGYYGGSAGVGPALDEDDFAGSASPFDEDTFAPAGVSSGAGFGAEGNGARRQRPREVLFEDEPAPRARAGADAPREPNGNGNGDGASETTTVRPRRPARQAAPPRNDGSCLIMGPTKVGKTTLLAALNRACHLPARDDLKLEFVAEGNTSAVLTRKAVEIVRDLKPGPDATSREQVDETEYPFMIHATTVSDGVLRRPRRTSVRMVVSDGPGKAFFPEDVEMENDHDYIRWRTKLVRDGRSAGSMILCVDSTDPSADLLEAHLGTMIYDMSELETFEEREPFESRLHRWVRRRPSLPYRPYQRRCLSVDRFLLLLTKVDLLCAGARTYGGPMNPLRAALMLDPVEQARQLLGVHLLNTIQDALRPGAAFAVGVTSAWGFHPVSKEPFAHPDGRPKGVDGERGKEVLPYWTPFGVRDAIYFIATGECRGTVRRVTSEHTVLRDDLDPLEVQFLNRSGI